MRDVELETQADAVAFERALPDSFGSGNGIGRLLRAGSRGLAMKNQWQTGAALDPVAFDAGMIRRNLSFIGSACGSHVEIENRTLQRERRHFDAGDALTQAVDRGFEGAVPRLVRVDDPT